MGDGRWYRRWGDGVGVPRQDDRLFAEWQVLVFAYLEELIDRQDAVMIYIIPAMAWCLSWHCTCDTFVPVMASYLG